MSTCEPPPDWIPVLAGQVAETFVAAALPAPMGCHVQPLRVADDDDVWEVSVFYGKTEIVGGHRDGLRTDTAFWVDLAKLFDLFEHVERLYWQAIPLGEDDELGSHIALEATYRGHPVHIRLLAVAPSRLPSARSADTLRGTFFDLW